MLLLNETLEERKKQLFAAIKADRETIQLVDRIIKKYPALRDTGLAIITSENQCIKQTFAELIALQRWVTTEEGIQHRERQKRLSNKQAS